MGIPQIVYGFLPGLVKLQDNTHAGDTGGLEKALGLFVDSDLFNKLLAFRRIKGLKKLRESDHVDQFVGNNVKRKGEQGQIGYLAQGMQDCVVLEAYFVKVNGNFITSWRGQG